MALSMLEMTRMVRLSNMLLRLGNTNSLCRRELAGNDKDKTTSAVDQIVMHGEIIIPDGDGLTGEKTIAVKADGFGTVAPKRGRWLPTCCRGAYSRCREPAVWITYSPPAVPCLGGGLSAAVGCRDGPKNPAGR